MRISRKAKLMALVGLALATQLAQAAVPLSVGTTITNITTDMSSMFDTVFPAVGAGVGLVIIIKLFKRFSSKI